MMRRYQAHPRRGYSLTVVLVFLILMFALWSTVYRGTSSLIRVETNRALQQTRDQGAMNALAQALQLLQYARPADASNPNRALFVYGVTMPIQGPTGVIESADKPEVDALVAKLREKNYGFRTLVHEVVQSKVFQTK